jgi:hypothetical protein
MLMDMLIILIRMIQMKKRTRRRPRLLINGIWITLLQ